MSKKFKVDTPAGQKELAREINKKIRPPKPFKLTPRLKIFWDLIIDARLTWTEIDLVQAYNLATLHADVQDLNERINEKLHIVPAEYMLRDKLTQTIMRLSSQLQVHAIATIGDNEQVRNKNAAKGKALRNKREFADDENLIPGSS